MKRAITILISIMLILQSLCVVSFAAEDAPNANIEFARALGIIDIEDEKAAEGITRIELASCFYNIIDNNINDDGSAVFADTQKDEKAIVDMVSALGIMTGDADGNFMPENGVTYNQLMKTMVVFLGYEYPAAEKGGYPYGYVAQANLLGLTLDGASNGDTPVTYGAVAKLFRQALEVDLCLNTNYTEAPHYTIRHGVNYLSHYMGVKTASGTITGNYMVNLANEIKCRYTQVFFEKEIMNLTAGSEGLQNKLGCDVFIYYKENNAEYDICYYEDLGGEVFEISGDDVIDVTSNYVTYFEGTKKKTARFDSSRAFILNGAYLASYTQSDLNPFSSGTKTGTIKLIDNDGNGNAEYVVISAYSTYVVSAVSDGKIYNVYEPATVLDITDYVEHNIEIVNVLGEPVTPTAIKKNHIISVLSVGSTVNKIIVSKDTYEGNVNSVAYNGSGIVSEITVGGVTFSAAQNCVVNDGSYTLEAGALVCLYFDCFGKVAYVEVDGMYSRDYQIGYIARGWTGLGLSEDVTLKIFGEDGYMHTLEVANKVNVNGTMVDRTNLLTTIGQNMDSSVVRQVVLYMTSAEDGKLNKLILADTSGTFSDTLYQFQPQSSLTYVSNLKSMGGYFVTSADTVYFSVPSEADKNEDKKYKLATDIPNQTSMAAIDAFGLRKEGLTADVIVLKDGAGTSMSSDERSPIFIVDKVLDVLTDDGYTKISITGAMVQGTTLTMNAQFYIEKDVLLTSTGGAMPKSGDVLRTATFSGEGNCDEVTILYDYQNDTVKFGGNPSESSLGALHRYVFGKVLENDGGNLKIELDGTSPAVTEIHNVNANYYRLISYEEKGRSGEHLISAGNASLIKPYSTYRDECSDVLIYSRGGTGIAVFIFN